MTFDPKDAVRHIVHDYVYLVAAGTDTQKPLPHPFNHYAERTFLVHCRAMADFFSAKTSGRDIFARNFTRKPFETRFPIWDKWKDHVDKHLMHLTVARITNKTPWTGEPNKCLLEEFMAVWDEFLAEMKDELKPLFKEAINRHRKEFKDYPLT